MNTNVTDAAAESTEGPSGGPPGREQFDGVSVEYETFAERVETEERFGALPAESCQSCHWGFVFAGGLLVRYDDREDVRVGANESFYIEPGHNLTIEAGTTLLEG